MTWIPTSERMPPERTYVLVWVKRPATKWAISLNQPAVAMYLHADESAQGKAKAPYWWADAAMAAGTLPDGCVTHWQPIEAPK